MPNGLSIQAKVANVLRRLKPAAKTWYFREVTISGGNPRLGIHTSTSVTDTVMDPPPAEEVIADEVVATSSGLYMAGDYKLTIAGSIDESLLRNRLLVRGTDVLRIVRYRPAGTIDGVVIVWEVIARTAKANS